MKVKDAIELLKTANPNWDLVAYSDPEGNEIHAVRDICLTDIVEDNRGRIEWSGEEDPASRVAVLIRVM
jgi:hypothetical protein